jgi:hypothetical protein
LKKLFFSVGIVILLIGIAVAANYNSSIPAIKIETVAETDVDNPTWQISADLVEGDVIRVRCHPGKNWEKPEFEPADDYVPINHRHIWFEIVDPNGNITEYNTAWASSPEGQFAMAFINVSIRGGGMEVEQYPIYVGGNATLNGTYTVRSNKDWFEPPPTLEPGPPTYLAIEKISSVTVYPYTYFLPTGISFSVIGMVISAWAARSPKPKKRFLRKSWFSENTFFEIILVKSQ